MKKIFQELVSWYYTPIGSTSSRLIAGTHDQYMYDNYGLYSIYIHYASPVTQYNYAGLTYSLNTSVIAAAVSGAQQTPEKICLFDLEFDGNGLEPVMDQTRIGESIGGTAVSEYTIDMVLNSFEEIYNRAKTMDPTIKVGFYGYPLLAHYTTIYQYYFFNNGTYTTNYNNWVRALQRNNQRYLGPTAGAGGTHGYTSHQFSAEIYAPSVGPVYDNLYFDAGYTGVLMSESGYSGEYRAGYERYCREMINQAKSIFVGDSLTSQIYLFISTYLVEHAVYFSKQASYPMWQIAYNEALGSTSNANGIIIWAGPGPSDTFQGYFTGGSGNYDIDSLMGITNGSIKIRLLASGVYINITGVDLNNYEGLFTYGTEEAFENYLNYKFNNAVYAYNNITGSEAAYRWPFAMGDIRFDLQNVSGVNRLYLRNVGGGLSGVNAVQPGNSGNLASKIPQFSGIPDLQSTVVGYQLAAGTASGSTNLLPYFTNVSRTTPYLDSSIDRANRNEFELYALNQDWFTLFSDRALLEKESLITGGNTSSNTGNTENNDNGLNINFVTNSKLEILDGKVITLNDIKFGFLRKK